MNWDSVKEKITDYAPLIASLIGGPKGFAVQALVSKLLGTDSDPKAIEAALSPENLEKIRKMEIENEQEKTFAPDFWDNPQEAQAHMKFIQSKTLQHSYSWHI